MGGKDKGKREQSSHIAKAWDAFSTRRKNRGLLAAPAKKEEIRKKTPRGNGNRRRRGTIRLHSVGNPGGTQLTTERPAPLSATMTQVSPGKNGVWAKGHPLLGGKTPGSTTPPNRRTASIKIEKKKGAGKSTRGRDQG